MRGVITNSLLRRAHSDELSGVALHCAASFYGVAVPALRRRLREWRATRGLEGPVSLKETQDRLAAVAARLDKRQTRRIVVRRVKERRKV